MDLYKFPNEIWEHIFSHIFPPRWGWSDQKVAILPKHLDLRLVCRDFNDIVLHCALRKFDMDYGQFEVRGLAAPYDATLRSMNTPMTTRFLVEKIRVNYGSRNSLLATVQKIGDAIFQVVDGREQGLDYKEKVWYGMCDLMVSHMDVVSYVVRGSRAPPVQNLGGSDGLPPRYGLTPTEKVHTLPVAVYLGDTWLLKRLIEKGGDINGKSQIFGSPLHVAATRNQEAALRLLLENGAKVNVLDSSNRSALRYAVIDGHEGITRLLLNTEGVDVNSDGSGVSILRVAVDHGHQQIVKLLLAHEGLNVNLTDSTGRTPLSMAAHNGDEAMVKLLLEHPGLNAGSRVSNGTALLEAIIASSEAVVRLLLDRQDVDPNSTGWGSIAPLIQAILQGEIAIAKLLLGRDDTNPNLMDRHRSPLSLAVSKRSPELTKALLERKDIQVNPEGRRGRTPLVMAAYSGDEQSVRLLLEHNQVFVDIGDHSGRTPLSAACSKGFDRVVKLLLERKEVRRDSRDVNNDTPLLLAAAKGHAAVVRLLLERSEADNDSATPQAYTNGTPSMPAVTEEMARTNSPVRNKDDLGLNHKNGIGRTALSSAAKSGHETVVKLLLERDDIDVYSEDKQGHTALDLAVLFRHTSVADLLRPRYTKHALEEQES